MAKPMRRLRALRSDAGIFIALLLGNATGKPSGSAEPGWASSTAGSTPATATSASRPNGGWLRDPRRSAAADFFLLTLAVITVAVSVAAITSTVRLLLVLACACVIPGSALLTRLSVDDVLEGFTLAVALSFVVEAAGALAMIWTGWWHPLGWAIAVVVIASVVLLRDLTRIVVSVRKTVYA